MDLSNLTLLIPAKFEKESLPRVINHLNNLNCRKLVVLAAEDIETIVRLRPWIEDEWRDSYGEFSKTKLITDYDAKSNIFKFKLHFFK